LASERTRWRGNGRDNLFVDYAGDTVPVIIDRLTDKTRPAQIFVAVMGASNFTYAEASWTQALADWIGAHTRVFEAIGGGPNLLVPDNTRVVVIKACLYEPQGQPHLRRDGGALRHGGPAGPTAAAARQSRSDASAARFPRYPITLPHVPMTDQYRCVVAIGKELLNTGTVYERVAFAGPGIGPLVICTAPSNVTQPGVTPSGQVTFVWSVGLNACEVMNKPRELPMPSWVRAGSIVVTLI
jgi:hypothetical protein